MVISKIGTKRIGRRLIFADVITWEFSTIVEVLIASTQFTIATIQQNINAALDKLKSDAERLITNEILTEEKQIELLQAIDRHCFRQAQTIVEEAARHAAAQNFDHLISDLDTLSRGLYQMSRMTGEMQPKN